jgi:hypothetical protein
VDVGGGWWPELRGRWCGSLTVGADGADFTLVIALGDDLLGGAPWRMSGRQGGCFFVACGGIR